MGKKSVRSSGARKRAGQRSASASRGLKRRDFLKRAGLAAGGLLVGREAAASPSRVGAGVALVRDPADATASAPAAQWAIGQVRQALESRGVAVRVCERPDQVRVGERCLVAAGGGSSAARALMQGRGVSLPGSAEALVLVSGRLGAHDALLAAGSDPRGLSYALTEIADRVRHADDPAAVWAVQAPVVERPANEIRSAMRLFVSDVEDKPWFQDRAFWPPYLDMLASQRFNRFNLSLGVGYDFARELRDTYLYFAYPFLLDVPGYGVRASRLPDAEREQNLRMLRFISDEAAARGLHFQLGLWTHAYHWTDSPDVNYVIEGLTPERHGPYCRDALRMLLQSCPAISGVTFRIHGESGVAEGNYGFWKTVFDGVVGAGRKIEIDMHAKGMDQGMIDVALGTGMPVTISPKFWAEHMGLPYHQASIRDFERPKPEAQASGLMALSAGARSFLRYGYGDLLAEDRKYKVLHRIWPGTQRLLLWGDPTYAAAYGRAFNFCGSAGFEFFEPLSFKGRKGSGLPGGRDGYADKTLRCAGGDWEKYRYTYRLWGRLTYNPDADAEVWRRQLRREYAAAAPVEAALAQASRILPLVTTAHDPSAANNGYWPEMYWDLSIVDASQPGPYWDTPSPKRFGTVSPLDPQLFATVDELADELLRESPSGKYSPAEVATQLESGSVQAAASLVRADAETPNRRDAAYRRMRVDTAVASGLGRFFAWKLRAAALYAVFERSGQDAALQQALKAYRSARQAWADLAGQAEGIYARDVTFGLEPQLRGHWADRLVAIDKDIAAMERQVGRVAVSGPGAEVLAKAIAAIVSPPECPRPRVEHAPPASFRRGAEIEIRMRPVGGEVTSVVLWYRRVNQADVFQPEDMLEDRGEFRAVIDGSYTDSAFPMQYYFQLRSRGGPLSLHPGFGADFLGQPYYVIRQVDGRARGEPLPPI